jgi:hypothetical protein
MAPFLSMGTRAIALLALSLLTTHVASQEAPAPDDNTVPSADPVAGPCEIFSTHGTCEVNSAGMIGCLCPNESFLTGESNAAFANINSPLGASCEQAVAGGQTSFSGGVVEFEGAPLACLKSNALAV